MAVSALAQLIANRPTYQPSATTKQTLATKILVMIVGPTGIGKSSVISEVTRLRPDYATVNIVTTRDRKPEDPVEFRTGSEGFTFDTALELLKNGEIVEYTINTNNQLYGQTAESFPAKVNLMAMLPKGLIPLQNVGFGRTVPIYLLADADEYKQRLESSRVSYVDFDARLHEALDSFQFAREHSSSFQFIVNTSGELENAAKQIIAALDGTPIKSPKTEALLDDMEHVVRSMLGEQ